MIAGRPSPRLRQEAPQSGGVKPLRSSPKGAEPRAAGFSPASMASGVDRIAALWGSPKAESAPFPAVLPNQRGGAAPLHRHGNPAPQRRKPWPERGGVRLLAKPSLALVRSMR